MSENKIPRFDPKEIQSTDVYPAVGEYYGYGEDSGIIAPRYHFPITPKENFYLFRDRKPFYWVPSLTNDFNLICPDIVPDFPACGMKGGIDSFGVTWIPTAPENGMPSFVKPGNPFLEDIADWKEKVHAPDVDSWDWEASGKLYMEGLSLERANCGIIMSGFFERLISLMDFEGAAMALIEDPESVCELMEVLTDYNIQVLEHYKQYYDVDLVMIHDDWGAQRAPFFSRALLQETILPYLTRFNQRAHELGVYVILHCCGNSEPFVEDMIASGTDAWQVQADANPNLLDTIVKYGDRIQFDPYGCFLDEDVQDEETARAQIMESYKAFTKTGAVMYGVMTFTYPGDVNALAYEAARKVASGEI